MSVRLGLLAVAILAVLIPATGAAAETVKVRGGIHQGFGRLVFDWPRKVSYEARLEEEGLVVIFSEPADFDFAGLDRLRPVYLDAMTPGPDGASFVFALRTPVELRHFRDGLKVVLDLHDSPAEPSAGTQPPDPAAPVSAGPRSAGPGSADDSVPAAMLRLRVRSAPCDEACRPSCLVVTFPF